MNSKLINNRPKEMTKEEFTKSWDNIGYTLVALHRTLEELKTSVKKTRETDFDCPNHYAKIAFQRGQIEAYNFILSILPESSKY